MLEKKHHFNTNTIWIGVKTAQCARLIRRWCWNGPIHLQGILVPTAVYPIKLYVHFLMMVIFDRVWAILPLHLVLKFGWDSFSHSKDRVHANIKKNQTQPKTIPFENFSFLKICLYINNMGWLLRYRSLALWFDLVTWFSTKGVKPRYAVLMLF